MSFLKRLFGGRSFPDIVAEADRFFDGGDFINARVEYTKALDTGSDDADAVERVRGRVAACLDGMAKERIAEARSLAAEGHEDLAAQELETALETAASEEVAGEAKAALEALEGGDAVRRAEDRPELDDEDRWAILAGTWSQEQLDEYDEYGETFRDALLALHDGRVEEGRAGLEALLSEAIGEAAPPAGDGPYRHPDDDAEADTPSAADVDADLVVYLWLEVGRARLLAEDAEAGEDALRTFIARLGDGEGGAARVSAHYELAALAEREGDEALAIEELQGAIDALPEDPRPYLELGRYLRTKKHHKDSVRVLRAAVSLLEGERVPWQFLSELGLAEAAVGIDDKARARLEEVIQTHVQNRQLDFPFEPAVGLAKLHEKGGELQRAADLYRSLAKGSHTDGHLTYHREAARILGELGETEEAHRMLTRALALVEEDDEETRSVIERQIEALR